MHGMNIGKIQLVSLPVSDQDRAKDFYVNTLGLDLVRDNPMGPEQRWVEVAPPGSATGISLVTWFPTMPPGSSKGLVLQTSDVDGDIARLKQAGVTVDGPQEAPWGRFATLDDPDGNGIVLAGPPPAGI
jgi:catechol 2,3-dioxygenase-like lactoylglutathione lyase family enzyme